MILFQCQRFVNGGNCQGPKPSRALALRPGVETMRMSGSDICTSADYCPAHFSAQVCALQRHWTTPLRPFLAHAVNESILSYKTRNDMVTTPSKDTQACYAGLSFDEAIESATRKRLEASACCKSCGATSTITAPGTGPHYARLNCAECGRFRRWLSRPLAAA